MSKDLRRRLDRLERHVAPPQIICLLDSLENRQLVAEGLLPTYALPGESEGAKGGYRKLTKSDVVVFLMEAEMNL